MINNGDGIVINMWRQRSQTNCDWQSIMGLLRLRLDKSPNFPIGWLGTSCRWVAIGRCTFHGGRIVLGFSLAYPREPLSELSDTYVWRKKELSKLHVSQLLAGAGRKFARFISGISISILRFVAEVVAFAFWIGQQLFLFRSDHRMGHLSPAELKTGQGAISGYGFWLGLYS